MFDMRVKKGPLPLVAAIAAAGLLAGCAQRQSITVGAVPDDYRTRHPIVLQDKDQVLDLPVGVFSYRMTQQQRAAIRGFLDRYEESGKAVVTMLVPEGSANASAAASAARDFATVLHESGVPEGYVQTLSYRASPEETAPIRLTYPVMSATVGPCGRWPEDILNTEENKQYENFGCAYQNNLAAQVANPNDFLVPRKMTTIDAENRGSAIDDYKERNISDAFIGTSEVEY